MSLAELIIKRITRRPPDFIIGGSDRPYLRRWWVIPRNPVFNVYLHQFLRSDDDRALHDHPWVNCSILLRGSYVEHTIAAGGIERRQLLTAPAMRLRLSGKLAHRIELLTQPAWDGYVRPGQICYAAPVERECWTLFITGPKYRSWGFHCPRQGWIHWHRFTADDDKGSIGKGCDA